jgi:short-subunit dehydrogenase
MLTKLFIPKMLEHGGGKIMIVSSVASFAPPSAIQPLYGPIKTFMNRFSDGININYNRNGITSTAVCPGFTTTGFHTASGVQEEMDRVPGFMVFPAARIAQEGIEATLAGKSLCVPTKTYKFLVFMLKNIPQSILRLIGTALAPGRYDRN